MQICHYTESFNDNWNLFQIQINQATHQVQRVCDEHEFG